VAIKQIGKQIERRVHQISRILMYIVAVLLFLIMLMQTVDVFGRYLFDKPLKAAMDYIEVAMSLVIFWGLAYCASENGHVRIDVVTSHISKRVLNIIDRFTFGAGAFILALMTWRLAFRAWTYLQHPPGPATLTMFVPYWPFLILAAVGCFFFFFEYLIRVFNPDSGTREIPLFETSKEDESSK
jgi:TRAP-type C4-dicarboxylate transport system permease small subunit